MLFGSQHFGGVEGSVGAPGWDQEELTSFNQLHGLAQHQHKVVSAQLEHLWCQEKPRATSDSQDSSRLGLRGSHHLPPYSILCTSLQHPHPNGFLYRDSQMGVLIAKVGTPTTLWDYNFLCKPSIGMRSKIKLQPLFKAFQRHVTYHLHAKTSSRFPTFCGQESNCQFDSRPFF